MGGLSYKRLGIMKRVLWIPKALISWQVSTRLDQQTLRAKNLWYVYFDGVIGKRRTTYIQSYANQEAEQYLKVFR